MLGGDIRINELLWETVGNEEYGRFRTEFSTILVLSDRGPFSYFVPMYTDCVMKFKYVQ